MGLATSAVVVAVISGCISFACAPRLVGTPLAPLTFAPWTPHAQLRGIGLSPKTPLDRADYDALDLVRPGSVVLFSVQLGQSDPVQQIGADPDLQRWLASHQDVTQIVRMWPVKGPEDPKRLALKIVGLHARYPWVTWFQVANEPDIEWSNATWSEIAEWTAAVWWDVDFLRHHVAGASDIRLLFPPLAQASPMDPEHVGYDALRESIELYLDHGDGLAAHEYWDRGDVYLIENQWPAWLQDRLSDILFFVTECGRRPGAKNGPPDDTLGDELVEFAQRTRATVVAPFVLSSPGGSFDQFDFVDRTGHARPQLLTWGAFGP